MTQHVFPDGRRVQSGFETVYTVEQTAALVEEIKAKTYDGVKARFLTLLEALLQAKGLGTGSIGRMVDILLQDVDNQVLAIAGKHVPDITPDLLEAKRIERDTVEAGASLDALRERQVRLESTLEDVKRTIEGRSLERARKSLANLAGWILDPAKIEDAIRVLDLSAKGGFATGGTVSASVGRNASETPETLMPSNVVQQVGQGIKEAFERGARLGRTSR